MSYTRIDVEAQEFAFSHVKGCYQLNLLKGVEAWSGATLRGKAVRDYGASYAASRQALLQRLQRDTRLSVVFVRGSHNRREVEIHLSDVGRYWLWVRRSEIGSDRRGERREVA